MKKQKLVFIINPISGVGKQKTIEKLIDKVLDKNTFEISIKYTQAPKHATILATESINEQADIVVAVGGDGTVNEVASALINSRVKLAIIPVGSGNGVARHLKIPLKIKNAISIINNQNYTIIDTAQINNVPFIMASGCGFDAFIADEFSKLKTRGFSGYIKLIAKHFLSYHPKHYKLSIDEVTFEKEAFLISVANCSQFGNNAYIAPKAVINDSLLNITIIKKFPLWSTGSIIIKLFSKKLNSSKHIETYTGKNIQISQNDFFAQMDGEPIYSGKEINIAICPSSLNVIVS